MSMGNCIDILVSPFVLPKEKIKVVIFNGGEEEFMPSTPVKQVTSGPYHGYNLVHPTEPHLPLPPESKLVSGEVYFLMPQLPLICNTPPVSQKMDEGEDHEKSGCASSSTGGRTFKVVVTKKQLKELLFVSNGSTTGLQELPLTEEEFAGRVFEMCRKWRPSLATIPELQMC